VGQKDKFIEFTVSIVTTTPSGKVFRTTPKTFFFDPAKKKVAEIGFGKEFQAAIQKTFAIKDGAVVLRGGPDLVVGDRQFRVDGIQTIVVFGGVYRFTADLHVVAVPEGTRARNSRGLWQVLKAGESVTMEFDYRDEVDPAQSPE
jgi:hypothetical protein